MNSKRRSELKKRANILKPVVIVGSDGYHKNVGDSVMNSFNTNELIKVKVNRVDSKDKSIVQEIAEKIRLDTKCDIIGIIGTTIILFKEHKDPSKRKF